MHSTLDLMNRAIERARQQDPTLSTRALSQSIGLSPNTLNVARHRGNLSPIAAGNLAAMLGEDVEHWMAVAVLEAEPKGPTTDTLRRAVLKRRNS